MKCTSCQADIRPVVALDVDGTMGMYYDQMIREFLPRYLGHPVPTKTPTFNGTMEMSDWCGLPKELYREAKLAFRQGGWKRFMPMYEGADVLARTLRDAGVEVWITTARPWLRLDNADPDTREWLHRNGIDYDHLLFGEDKYVELMKRVGRERIVAVLDDELEQCRKCEALGLPFVLRRNEWNAGVQWYNNVKDLNHALTVIMAMVRQWEERHGH